MDRVSVIIPNYNSGAFLQRTIQSVLAQTYPVHEIIICDDGSTDNSERIVKGFENNKIKWLECGRNGMPAIPRNMGIAIAEGEWIAFLDSDDEWTEKKIEHQLILARENNFLAICCNAYRITNDTAGNEKYFTSATRVIKFKELLRSNPVICSSVFIQKKMLAKLGGFPADKEFKAIEDYLLWLKAASLHDWYFIAEPLVKYRDVPGESIRKEQRSEYEKKMLICSTYLRWNAFRFPFSFLTALSYTSRLMLNNLLRAGK